MSKNSNRPPIWNGPLIIRGVRRKQPDISKISRAVIGLALREAALEAEAEAQGAASAANEDAERSRDGERPGDPRV